MKDAILIPGLSQINQDAWQSWLLTKAPICCTRLNTYHESMYQSPCWSILVPFWGDLHAH